MSVENGIKIYTAALDKIPKDQLPLVEQHLNSLKWVHELFKVQEREGFYPAGLTDRTLFEHSAKNPELLSPYKRVRWRWQPWPITERLQAIDYIEDDSTRLIATQLINSMERTINDIRRHKLPQALLIIDSIRPQIEAWKTGKFEEAMFELLNMRHLPSLSLFTLLLDRYLDTRGFKYAGQGWLLNTDKGMTRDYNLILKSALAGTGEEEKHQVIVGDAIAFAGLAARRGGWSGNTWPSEDYLRKDFGSRSLVFINRFYEKFEEDLRGALLKYTPEVEETSYWEYKAKKAAIISLILHEGYGHSQVPFDETAINVLKESYTTTKELACEVLSHKAVLGLPNRLVSTDIKKMVINVSLVWATTDYEDYLKETDPIKKRALEAYAKASQCLRNYYSTKEAIKINMDNGTIKILDVDLLHMAAREFEHGLRQATKDEKVQKGSLRKFFEQNVCNNNYCQVIAS